MDATDTGSAIAANAIRCIDLLHRLLLFWILLALALLFSPPSGSTVALKLPFTELSVPALLAKILLASVLFLVGFAARELLLQLKDVARKLIGSDHLLVVLTYPSIATIRNPSSRVMAGLLITYSQVLLELSLFGPSQPPVASIHVWLASYLPFQC
jgi:hypothetical protein